MSEPAATPATALPFIKNASLIRLKLLAMQPGETIQVNPAELPAAYKSVKPLCTNIQRSYGFYYGVLKLSSEAGWQVTRVNTAEEAESFTPKRKKGKSSPADEPPRLYTITDAELIELILQKIAFATRDIAELSVRGVSPAELNLLNTDTLNFGAMPGDVQMRADEGKAVEIKDAARKVLETRLGNLRTMAENTFGTGSTDYAVFGFEGMTGETDDRLLRLAKRVLRQGTANQAAMSPWGCTPAFLSLLQTDITAFDTEIDNAQTAEADRKKATALRVKTGNSLYTRVDKICNTGKDVFRAVSAAKYNDYLIYS